MKRRSKSQGLVSKVLGFGGLGVLIWGFGVLKVIVPGVRVEGLGSGAWGLGVRVLGGPEAEETFLQPAVKLFPEL